MRSVLHHEGFKRDVLLPENWFYRDDGKNNIQILTDNADLLESFVAGLEFLKENSFSDKDISNYNKFEKNRLLVRKSSLSDWEENSNMPTGWKSRSGVKTLIFQIGRAHV